eukprot:2361532-Prymnesium_polylepis.1
MGDACVSSAPAEIDGTEPRQGLGQHSLGRAGDARTFMPLVVCASNLVCPSRAGATRRVISASTHRRRNLSCCSRQLS